MAWKPTRPWCLPCRERDGSDWCWGVLSDADQAAMTQAVRELHPRGGRVTRVTEQIWVVRLLLRQQRPPNTVEATWKADAASWAALEAET
jgi:hypothetical protein